MILKSRCPLPPGPGRYQFFNLGRFQRNPVESFEQLWMQYGDIFFLPILPNFRILLLSHPRYVERVFNSPQVYGKSPLTLKNMGLVQGQGLFTSEGEHWQRHRRLMQPAFHPRYLTQLHHSIMGCVQAAIATWHQHPKDTPLDFATEMTQLTLKIVSMALFSVDISGSSVLGKACRHAIVYAYERMSNPLALPATFPTPANLKFKQTKQTIDQMVQALIQQRRNHAPDKIDLLSLLMAAQDEETGQGLSDRQLQDELITLINAGHETSATTLAWIWILLGQHPEVFDKLKTEVDTVLKGAIAQPEHIPQLTYTRSVIDESLRIRPPGFGLMRTALQSSEIDGYYIPKGTHCIAVQTNIFRHPEFWSDANQFIPERFDCDRSHIRHKYAYFPFGVGPHRCIGQNFAILELVLILVSTIQKFDVRVCPHQTFDIDPRFTLRPRHGVNVTLTARSH